MSTVWAFRTASDYGFNLIGKRRKQYERSTNVWVWVENYMGPLAKEDEFVAALQSDPNPPETIDIDEDGDIVTIQAKYPAQTSNTDQGGAANQDPIFAAWTMTANVGNAPLIEDPRFVPIKGNDGIERGFTRDVIASILLQVQHWKSKKRQLADNKVEGDPTMPALDLNQFSADVAEYCAAVFNNFAADIRQAMIIAGQELFENLATENDQIEIIQPVLRKNMVLSSATQVKVAWANVNRFYTWSALRNEEPTIDTAVVIGVETLSDVSTSNSWYWQKRPPIIDVQSDGKRQLTLEWWAVKGFDRWRYGEPIT